MCENMNAVPLPLIGNLAAQDATGLACWWYRAVRRRPLALMRMMIAGCYMTHLSPARHLAIVTTRLPLPILAVRRGGYLPLRLVRKSDQ